MNAQVIDLMGIYVPSAGVAIASVFLLLFGLRWVLDRFGFFDWVWHRGLVEVSLFILLLGAVLLLTAGPSILPLLTF